MEHFLLQIFVFFVAAAIAVPVAKKTGIGSVLGYLAAGVVIGPFGLSLIGDVESVMHFTEFGVVMMLFLIGLEMKPAVLWQMRNSILGLGGGQVVVTTLLIMFAGVWFLPGRQALVLGLILSLSSTAIVLQLLKDRGRSDTSVGRSIFSVVLFHDLAIVPIMALLPLLATVGAHESVQHKVLADISGFSGGVRFLLTMLAISAVFFMGRFVTKPLFRAIALTGMRELFAAASLALVVASSLLMTVVGLPAPLGTFLAGVVLAESEYRHELESNIEPFKGLLLGIFFISIGASLNFALLREQWWVVCLLVAGIVVFKFVVLYLIAVLFRLPAHERGYFSIVPAQGGTFAFILLPFAVQSGALPAVVAELVLTAVVITMFLTPLMATGWEKFIERRVESKKGADDLSPQGQRVIIAGFGRLGTDLGRLLISVGIKPVILDHDPVGVETLRNFGFKVFYGDVTRLDLLEAAGIAEASMLIVTISNAEKAKELVELVQKHYPHLEIAIAVDDWRAVFEMKDLGVSLIRRETRDSALDLGVDCLKLLGMHSYEAFRLLRMFKHQDLRASDDLYEVWREKGEETFISSFRDYNNNLTALLQRAQTTNMEEAGRGWASDKIIRATGGRPADPPEVGG
ncbi:cation:proton antiporter [Desulforhopalus vacuolatus]|uniref:cation:proton antiporter domain-containing protein n=1 Tax=Desulforhopalus vacuolatus TaxID=40414 RepID=UPI0019628F26|nr:cation:proton antiporter [Desulforhopalus vacuolatus]MBM9520123.1 cation:proton antiporter [Desulforhopalus vacuolatus]